MTLLDAIITGVKKPCQCEPKRFDIQKKEWKNAKQFSSNIFKEFAHHASGKTKYVTVKRWLANCPSCGKMWLALSSKKALMGAIKEMNNNGQQPKGKKGSE